MVFSVKEMSRFLLCPGTLGTLVDNCINVSGDEGEQTRDRTSSKRVAGGVGSAGDITIHELRVGGVANSSGGITTVSSDRVLFRRALSLGERKAGLAKIGLVCL